MSTSTVSRTEVVKMKKVDRVKPGHEAEADIFDRQEKVPGHDQRAFQDVGFLLAGAGGLNSWAGVGLLRTGATSMTITDDDLVEKPNLSRQLFNERDLGKPKAHRLIENLGDHAVGGCVLTGIALRFQEATEQFPIAADVLVVGVDNNICRQACVKWARQHHVPAIFTMLSKDGTRCHCFLQGPSPEDACLWCAQPNMDPNEVAECGVGSIITSCLLASAYTIYFAHRAIMGWPMNVEPFNWREADLSGMTPEKSATITRRQDCCICGG